MEEGPSVSIESPDIADRILSILKLSANGWSHDITIPPSSAIPSFANCENQLNYKTFWFKLDEEPLLTVGFDWDAREPNIVKTRSGAFPHLTPINLSYITSKRRLAEFFDSSRDSFLCHKRELQLKLRERKRFKPFLSQLLRKTIVILTTPIG